MTGGRQSEAYRTWLRFYNRARHPSFIGYQAGLTQERAEWYADRLFSDYTNGIDVRPLLDALEVELREWNNIGRKVWDSEACVWKEPTDAPA